VAAPASACGSWWISSTTSDGRAGLSDRTASCRKVWRANIGAHRGGEVAGRSRQEHRRGSRRRYGSDCRTALPPWDLPPRAKPLPDLAIRSCLSRRREDRLARLRLRVEVVARTAAPRAQRDSVIETHRDGPASAGSSRCRPQGVLVVTLRVATAAEPSRRWPRPGHFTTDPLVWPGPCAVGAHGCINRETSAQGVGSVPPAPWAPTQGDARLRGVRPVAAVQRQAASRAREIRALRRRSGGLGGV
jgi:hypothetical protein